MIRKAVLTGLQKLYTAQGRISNRLIDSFPGLPSQVHIRRHFGSVPDAMRQAGLPVLSHSQIQRRAWKRRKAAGCDEYYLGVRWTDAKLLGALHQLQKQYGYISANLLDQNGGTPSAYYFIKPFCWPDPFGWKARAIWLATAKIASQLTKPKYRRVRAARSFLAHFIDAKLNRQIRRKWRQLLHRAT